MSATQPVIECMRHPGNSDPACRACWAASLVERATERDDLLLRVDALKRRLAWALREARTGFTSHTYGPRRGVWSDSILRSASRSRRVPR